MAHTRASLLLAALLPMAVHAQEPVPVDDPVLEQLDKLSMLPWLKNDPFVTDAAVLNVHGFAPDEVPTYPADVIRRRLLTLDEVSPCKLTYNTQVQAYIDMYAQRKREQTARMMGLAQLYFPVFEEALDRYNMPQELKYLAVVESALYPGAKSRAAAVGLWQFMIGTGKMYGLRSDSYVDERCDIYKSTDAACRYLRDLHRIFGSWELALAAYNCGPGNVNKAVRRAGGTLDYWAIYDHLPRETRGYVPAFIAVNYIFNHAADHNIYPVIPNYCAYEVDTVQVCHPLVLDHLAEVIGGNAQELRDLNPVYKLGVVPDMDKPATIYLPRDLVAAFIRHEQALAYSYRPDASAPAPGMAVAAAAARSTTSAAPAKTHVVRKGESLGVIAKKHGTTVQQLRNLNHLRHDRIAVGQKLVVRRGAPETAASKAPPATASEELDYIYHTIQKGDTLWGIAQRYPGASVDEIKRLNDANDTQNLPIGKKLKVSVQKS